jgi:DNA sulfur modification protein DndD
VAMLWGLARVAGRSLPTIIDTPLGRLDGIHRLTVVDRYFPNASDQVILLSTDKEIDAELAGRLEPAIGRRYQLVFDEELQSTVIESGYFAEESNVA